MGSGTGDGMNVGGGAAAGPRWRRSDILVRLLLALGVLAIIAGALAAMLSGLGYRWGWWHFSTGFSVLRWTVYGTLAGFAISAAALLSAVLSRRRGLALVALLAMVLGAGVLSVPLGHWLWARGIPPIHDISTDLDRPPAFVALRAEREAAPNRVEHPGEVTARLQRQAYPHVAPIRLVAERDAVFTAAEQLARDLEWQIVETDPQDGRIEAVDRTFWFGFRDDVVVRISEEGGQTRVDVRSASRVGRSDLGTNARRISHFLKQLQDRVLSGG